MLHLKCNFRIFFLILLVCLNYSCQSTKATITTKFSEVEVAVVYSNAASIRAIQTVNDTIFYGGSDNKIGYIAPTGIKKELQIDSAFEKSEFRSIAVTNKYFFCLAVANPALLYRFSKNLMQKELVYQENNQKVFYDSMHFFNNQDGIAIGDPTENCLSIIKTRDSGKTWQKIDCSNLPKTHQGEAAFAASNTNICIQGNSCWIVSGGKKSRVFHSKDKGLSWKVYDTPIIQGETMTGIFTAAFYNTKIGFIAGGNYDKPNQNYQNKAITFNSGKTWKLVGENTGFGYASCVQFVPNSNGSQLVSVGTNGLFYSFDFGQTWQKFLDDSNLYSIRFTATNQAIASGKNKIVKLTFK